VRSRTLRAGRPQTVRHGLHLLVIGLASERLEKPSATGTPGARAARGTGGLAFGVRDRLRRGPDAPGRCSSASSLRERPPTPRFVVDLPLQAAVQADTAFVCRIGRYRSFAQVACPRRCLTGNPTAREAGSRKWANSLPERAVKGATHDQRGNQTGNAIAACFPIDRTKCGYPQPLRRIA
jgi:hypothetical protein